VQILHLSRAETTEPINTKFGTIDYLGEIKRIAKFGCDRFKGSVSPSGCNIQYSVFSSGFFDQARDHNSQRILMYYGSKDAVWRKDVPFEYPKC